MTPPVDVMPYAASRHAAPPSRLGQRYAADVFLPEPGNTVVCHLDIADPTHVAVLAARNAMRALNGSQSFLFTPVQSLHMTLFEGVIETRRTTDAWPEDIPQDTPVGAVTEALLPRLAAFQPLEPFSVRVVGLRPTGLMLEGATAKDAAVMRAWRDALTAPFGYRHTAHNEYRFHMTFAYPVQWIEDTQVPLWEAAFAEILSDLQRDAPVIPLRAPAFCQFNDMTRFEELMVLR